ncbi:MAG: site-specific recombinase [Patescibacteria group bacterium]|nr:site-specific recombinase [Patescibacteria group bacterium]
MANLTDEMDVTKLRFVLYARKSTEDEGSQVNSIDDQIRHCMEYAESHNLRVVKIIKEEKSAKKANNRPLFLEMLSEFPKRYDGLLAYHPDRIARNMRDAGIIIDMLNPDNALIKNMAFPTVQYANDSSGRLTLAVLFSLATQFSEHLSEMVKRGVDTNLDKGISSGTPKWGYTRSDVTGYYEQNEFYRFIQKAWIMRTEGETLETIARYLKSNDVHRMTKITRKNKRTRRIDLDINGLNKMFKDSFYYGVLVQGDQLVDLRKLINFEPMVLEDIYDNVQTVGYKKSRLKPRGIKTDVFYPFRGMVFCGVCQSDSPMRVGKNKSQTGEHFLSYRCDNKHCQRKPKSVRAKYILEPLYETLKTLQFTDKEYEKYSKRLDELTDNKVEELQIERRSLNGRKTNLQKRRDDLSRKLINLDKRSPAYGTNEQDLLDLQNEIIDLETDINKITAKLTNSSKIKLTKDEFLNLANSAYNKVLAGSPVEKDIILRKMCLNLTLDNKRTPTFIWREPFATLIEMRQHSLGARERT